MLNANSNTTYGGKCKVVYNEFDGNMIGFKSQQAFNNFSFNIGDELLYIAYSDNGEKSIIDSPTSDQTYTFQYGMENFCPGLPTVTYEGQVYNTVLIGSQCWLKENLNIGTRIDGINNMTNDNTIEKYCYDDLESNCDIYGALYQWNELMEYSTIEGTQGICPDEWHVATDMEWFQMANYLDPTFTDPYYQDTENGIPEFFHT